MGILNFDREKLLSVLKTAQEKEKSGGFVQDERFWNPEKPDKDKTTTYRIRPIPIITKAGYPEPEIKYFQHQWQSPITGKWVTELCPTSLGKSCPICEHSRKLYNSEDATDKEDSRKIKRNAKYAINILVVKESADEKRKVNEGKVFMFKYGMKIHDKFQQALFPDEDSGKEPILFFDPVGGFDFLLTVKKVDKYPNYDSSEFARTSTKLASTDDAIVEILNSAYNLSQELLNPADIKSYDELKNILETQWYGLGNQEVGNKNQASTGANQTSTKASVVEDTDSTQGNPATETDDDFVKNLEKELGL